MDTEIFCVCPLFSRLMMKNGNLIEQPGIKTSIDGDGNFTSSANPLIELNQEISKHVVLIF